MESNRSTGIPALYFLVSLQGIILLFIVGSVIFGLTTDNLYFDHITPISIGSLVLFVILFLAGCVSNKLYFTFLVFQVIAFPSAVDNFFPGVFQGKVSELDASIFPLFTHIDLYLLLGIVKGIRNRIKAGVVYNRLLVLSVSVLFVSSWINLFYSKNEQDFLLVVAGFIHVRYLIWFYILFLLYDPLTYGKAIVNGLILSVIFLFVEAVVFSSINHDPRLSSGTLGNNSFGNIMASITVYFVFVLRTKVYQNRMLLRIAIAIGVTTVVLTGTRMAVFGGVALFLVGIYFHSRESFVRLFTVLLVSGGILFAFLFTDVYRKNVPKRYNIQHLLSKVHFQWPGHGRNIVVIEMDKETLSLLTRLKLYNTSLNMIADSPVFGIGSMRWNYHKNDFGFDERVLIDSHNGYLATLSQFGLLAIFFIFFIFFHPIRYLGDKNAQGENSYLTYLALIPLGMAISDLTNAGIYKHQIYGLLCLTIMILISNRGRLKSPADRED